MDNRELKQRHSWATDSNHNSQMFPSLAWFYSLPRTGKALVDDCGLMLQTRWCKNAPKREKFDFRLPSVVQKRLCLSPLMSHHYNSSNWYNVQGAVHTRTHQPWSWWVQCYCSDGLCWILGKYAEISFYKLYKSKEASIWVCEKMAPKKKCVT